MKCYCKYNKLFCVETDNWNVDCAYACYNKYDWFKYSYKPKIIFYSVLQLIIMMRIKVRISTRSQSRIHK